MSVKPRQPESRDRLDSWKEIAAYLGRSVRTVRRWEATEGLPVHRHRHGKGSTVYAYRVEIDEWTGTRLLGAESVVRIEEPEVPEPARPVRWPLIAATVLVLIIGAALVLRFGNGREEPGPEETVRLSEREWLLVADVENRTGEAALDGLELVLVAEAERWELFRLVPGERIGENLNRMRRKQDAVLDLPTAIEVCQRDGGIRAVLAGSVEQVADGYQVRVALVDPQQGADLLGMSAEAVSQSEAVAALRHLATRLRKGIPSGWSTTAPAIVAPERVTTDSLHALGLYTRAGTLMRDGKPDAAERLLREAVEEDLEFTSAQIRLAWALEDSGVAEPEAREVAARLMSASIEGLSNAERLYVEASMRHLAGDSEEALASYEALLSLDPEHEWGTTRLIALYGELNRDAEAAPHAARLADRKPDDFSAQHRAAHALAVWAGEPERARPYVRRALGLISPRTAAEEPDAVAWLELFPAYELWQAGDTAGALEAVAAATVSFDDLGGPLRDRLAQHIGLLLLASGRLDEARSWLTRIGAPAFRHEMLAMVPFAAGDRDALRAHLLAGTRYREPFTSILLGMTGLPDESAEVLSGLERREPGSERASVARDILLLMGGSPEIAVPRLERAAEGLRASDGVFFAGADMLAMALAKQGRLSKAVEVLEGTSQIRTGAAFSGTGLFWVKCQLQLARLYDRIGREPDASAVRRELESALSQADPDNPLLAELNEAG